MSKVLIVEDHALIRFGLKTAFESKQFIDEIFEASTAEDAIALVNTKQIDAVIMDLGLPNMNGIEATKEIKNINKNIKVIILTSHSSEQEVLDSIKAGASAYCSKDINPDRLADTVQSVIEGATCHQIGYVQADQAFFLQLRRHIPQCHALGKAFGNGCFAYSGFPDERRIVFILAA